MAFTHAVSTNNYGVAKFIVTTAANIANGTHITLQSALDSASSGDTVFLRDSITENVTIPAGVNIAGWNGGNLNMPTITGTITMTTAGTCNISGIRLLTNAAAVVAVTGSAASVINLHNCFIDAADNNAITQSSTSASSIIRLNNCQGELRSNTSFFANSGSGRIIFNYCFLNNIGGSTTESTCSSGSITCRWSTFTFRITTSGTGGVIGNHNSFNCNTINQISYTCGGSGGSVIGFSEFASGTETAITVTSTIQLNQCSILSSNANAISGAGTITYDGLVFSSTSSNISTTTQTLLKAGPSVTIGSENTGNTNTLTVTNTSNTASSSANILSQVQGGTAADPTHQSSVSGVTTWTWGIDNSDSDAWVLAQGTALGTNNAIRASTAGELTYPLQPAFLAHVNTAITNVTGDGTTYTIIYDTEDFDQNGDFNLGTSTFTAPVTGKYHFDFILRISGGTSITAANCSIVTTARTYSRALNSPTTGAQTNCEAMVSVLADMTAGNTATVTVTTTDTGGKVDDVTGLSGGEVRNCFSGYLVC